MRVCVIGSGYVGLVAGACFAEAGHDVTLVDTNPEKIARILQGDSPIYEPGLSDVLRNGLAAGRLRATTSTADGVRGADVALLAVGTPSLLDGSADLSFVLAAAEAVGRALTQWTLVVTKSTVPVGTEAKIRATIERVATCPFDVASNPEFLKEGAAVEDFLKPDRVIVGVRSDRALDTLRRLYAPFLIRGDRMIVMDPVSSELTKYACNAMLATRVSFMNELSRICDASGADIGLVRAGMGSDRRIGPDFLYASLGWGGSCFPKDVAELVHLGERLDEPAGIARAAQEANARQRTTFVRRIVTHFGGSLTGRTLAVWGLAFKARTDDVRDSAAIDVVRGLLDHGAVVRVHDPKAMESARLFLGDDVVWCADALTAARGCDGLVVCTEWHDYRGIDVERVREALAGNVIFDGRNLWDPQRFVGSGLRYESIGRPTVDGR